MTKWKRLKKLRERKRAEAEALNPKTEPETKLIEPETKPIERTNLGDPRKMKKPEPPRTFNSNPILAQIPRYVYLIAFFTLLAGIFFPLITPGITIFHVILGVATLFLGLAGGILLFKAATSDSIRVGLIAIGLALISISLVLIYQLQATSSVDQLMA